MPDERPIAADEPDEKPSGDYSGEFADAKKGQVPKSTSQQDDGTAYGESRYDADGALKSRHDGEGPPDEIWEHDEERLNPSIGEGSATGAPAGRPSGPSNSA